MNGNSKADGDGSGETNDNSPTFTQQYSFSVGDDGEINGEIEPSEESVETSLETFGADVDHRERDSKIAQPEASTFGVDDRKTVTRSEGGEQHSLFADTDDDQQTLTGERAASQCLFGNDSSDMADNPDKPDTPNESREDSPNDHDQRAEQGDDGEQSTPTPRTSGETTLRVVTDGGCVGEHEDRENSPDDHADRNEHAEQGDHAEQLDRSEVMVAIPRFKLACIADALDDERRTIERNAGTGPWTTMLAEHVESCRGVLSTLDENDERAPISRSVAEGAATALQVAAKTETGDYADELRGLVELLRGALNKQAQPDRDVD